MKLARVLALALALAMLVLAAGCTKRNDNNSGGVVDDVVSSIEDGVEDLQSGLENGMSEVEDDLDMSDDDGEYSDEDGFLDEDSHLDDISDLEDQSLLDDDMDEDESIAAAMSTDYNIIGALDATLDNGFPGGPVDEQNRPSGPIGYQEKYGEYSAQFIVPSSQKIFLTFDEGYENGYTEQILDVLKEKNVKAVFFITYDYAKGEPELVKRMVEEGHVLGNHSTKHQTYPTMTLTDAAKDLMTLHDYVQAQFGYEMWLFRPPEGAFSEQTLALTQSLGYTTLLWSFAYKDYDVDNQPLTLEATDRIVSRAHPGEICLLHAVSKTNAEILGDVIDQLREKGFEFSDYFVFN